MTTSVSARFQDRQIGKQSPAEDYYSLEDYVRAARNDQELIIMLVGYRCIFDQRERYNKRLISLIQGYLLTLVLVTTCLNSNLS